MRRTALIIFGVGNPLIRCIPLNGLPAPSESNERTSVACTLQVLSSFLAMTIILFLDQWQEALQLDQ